MNPFDEITQTVVEKRYDMNRLLEIQSILDWPQQLTHLQGLHDQILSASIPHALLFTGATSATSDFAQYLAKLILCTSDTPPCGVCLSCIQFQTSNHPDCFVVDAVALGRLKTSDVESLQEWLVQKPHYGKRKVYVIHGMDLATPVAANRLLKTLEEPIGHIFAIMTAGHAQLVLPTILSRSFVYSLHQIGETFADSASIVAIQHAREAENSEFATFFHALIQWMKDWLQKKEQSLLLASGWMGMTKDRDSAECLTLLAACLRDLMHLSLGNSRQLQFDEFSAELQELSTFLTVDKWVRTIQVVLDSKKRLNAHVALLLNIEQMCIRLREVVVCLT